MKNKIISLISGVSLVSGLAVGPAVFASNTADVANALTGLTAVQIPVKAADLLTKASLTEKQNVAVAAVKAAIKLNPSVTTEVVSSLATANPETAPAVAVAAVTLQHKQIGMITKAATVAAPKQAVQIVAALLKEFPKDYGVIAIAATEGAPSATREILAVVAKAVPSMQALVQNDSNSSDVVAMVNQSMTPAGSVASAPQTTLPIAPQVSGPVISSGPFTPFFGTPGTITPSQLTPVPAGGRTYATPGN
jgi:hypothetical protein